MAQPALLIRAPDGATRKVHLTGGQLTLGRLRDNDLAYPDDRSLSRHHLRFLWEREGWLLEDLGAKNGTFVNGAKVTRRRRLDPGDEITAGRLSIRFDEADRLASGPVEFYAGPEDAARGATVVTSLDGILGKEAAARTFSGARAGRLGGVPVRVLDHPAFNALVRAGRELGGDRPLPELCQMILDLSLQAVGAEAGVVMTIDGKELLPRAVRGDRFRISSAVRDKVLEERTSILVQDTLKDEVLRGKESIHEQHIRSIMAVPLQTMDRVIGLVYVDSRDVVREFSADDLELLTVLANVAATRLEQERLTAAAFQAELLERDFLQAAEIQRGLLPRSLPEIEGLELAGHNAACRTVGGDYYDVLTYPDGRVLLALADVAGKGLPAALLMCNLQARVRVLAESTDDLVRIVETLDRSMADSCPPNRFVSLFLSLVDPRTGGVGYCNAGHNPALLVRDDRSVVRLTPCGPILGVLTGLGHEARLTTLGPGDVLAIYSDGVTEAVNPDGEEFGEERLAQLLAGRRGEPAQAHLAAVLEAVQEWTRDAPPADDITLLVARRV